MKYLTPWHESRSSVTHGKLAIQGERRNEYAVRLHVFCRYLQLHVDVVVSSCMCVFAECDAIDTWAAWVSDRWGDDAQKEAEAVCDRF